MVKQLNHEECKKLHKKLHNNIFNINIFIINKYSYRNIYSAKYIKISIIIVKKVV